MFGQARLNFIGTQAQFRQGRNHTLECLATPTFRHAVGDDIVNICILIRCLAEIERIGAAIPARITVGFWRSFDALRIKRIEEISLRKILATAKLTL